MLKVQSILVLFLFIGVDTFSQSTFYTEANITIKSSATLTIKGSFKNSETGSVSNLGTLNLGGDWTNIASNSVFDTTAGFVYVSGKRIINLSGDTYFNQLEIDNLKGVSVSSGTMKVKQTLTLSSGNFETNDAVILISDSIETARIAEISGGSISGNITMERYINADNNNWRFLSTPVSGITFEEWDDDFITSGLIGSDFPDFPSAIDPFESIYSFDETLSGVSGTGFVAIDSMGSTIGVGEGYWVWCGDSSSGDQDFTIDVVGPANTGSVSLPVNYTETGSDEDGWNMVGNPYPSAIDWDSGSWTKTNIDNAVYIWDPNANQYASYVDGVPNNGGSNVIASSQGFWIKSSATSPVLTASEAIKKDTNQSFIKKSRSSSQPFRIKIEGQGLTDETSLVKNQLASSNFDSKYDAYKIQSLNASSPNLSSRSLDEKELSINSISTKELIEIPIDLKIGKSGEYQLSFNNVAQFSQSSCLLFYDKKEETWTDLRKVNQLTIEAKKSDDKKRFILHVGAAIQLKGIAPSCEEISDGKIKIEVHSENEYSLTLRKDEELINTSEENGTIEIEALDAGIYSVQISDFNECGSIDRTIVIDDAPQLIADFKIEKQEKFTIDFKNESIGGNQYYWDFGDGFEAFSRNVSHTYLTSGKFKTSLRIENREGCDKLTELELFIDPILSVPFDQKTTPFYIFPNPVNDHFNLSITNLEWSGADYSISSIIGKELIKGKLQETQTLLNIPQLKSGIYVLTLLKNGKKQTIEFHKTTN